jgi:hypothetical protein
MFSIALALAASLFTWTLQSEETGFFLSYDDVATLSGPVSYELPPGPIINPEPELTLAWVVSQSKGNSAWPAPWSDDLSSLGYDIDTVGIYWGDPNAEPITVNLTGPSYTLRVWIRTDHHRQQWYGDGYGTATRQGFWDSQDSIEIFPAGN